MRQDIHVKLDLSVPTRTFVLAMTAVLLVTVTPELGSENVTLSTYYPAPSGVYSKMITTGNTYLATTAGNVGIGTTSPGSKLSVTGDGTGTANIGGGFCGGNYTGLTLNGQTSGCANYNILSSPTDPNLYINAPSGSSIKFRANNADIMSLAAGNVTFATAISLNLFAAYLHVNQSNEGGVPAINQCTAVAGIPNAAMCAAGQYVSFQAGIYTEGWSYQNRGGGNVVYLPPASGSPNAKVNQVYAFDNVVGSPGNGNWYMSTLAQDFTNPDTVFCCPK